MCVKMELSKNVQKVFDLVKDLTAIELNELVKGLEEEFDVSAAAGAMVVAG
jgi:large subunit ribosomal protein L7/L12